MFVSPLLKLIELKIDSAGGPIPFPAVEKDLNDALICNVWVESATQLTASPYDGRVNFAAADIPKCSLVMKDVNGSHARIDNVPLYEYDRSVNSGISAPFKKFRWSPSNCLVNVNTPTLTPTQCILLTIAYIPVRVTVDPVTGKEILIELL